MKYRINEIFYSLQGEGYWTGRAVNFVRFSGCNLSCSFCDTNHAYFKTMSVEDILGTLKPGPVVLTGGEPCLQVDSTLIYALHLAGHQTHMETNGSLPVPHGIDWLTVSPKTRNFVKHGNELKVLFTGEDLKCFEILSFDHFFVQPLHGEPVQPVIDFVLSNPKWRLSCQLHKILNIR